ncbi:MAG: protein-L-isoaspartate(D-aspartate) O-methyltransferase [Candidatus Aenigmatarchaeota archaeon]
MDLDKQRKEMVQFLENCGYIKYPAVKAAMLKVKREDFVLPEYRDKAYSNVPLPIPGNMTISAEHMHAIFLSVLNLKPGEKVLEIGAGSGILLAYMKEIVGEKGEVYGIEIIPETYEFAKKNLKKTGYWNKVKLVLGDGSKGLPEFAPYDKIVSSAAPRERIPKAWVDQLKPGGILVTPLGPPYSQDLICLEKTKDGKIKKKNLGPVVFVELIEK